jgi:hypothetical protein
MDLSEALKTILSKESQMGSVAREIIQPVVDHMDAGVIRPVTDVERRAIMNLINGDDK